MPKHVFKFNDNPVILFSPSTGKKKKIAALRIITFYIFKHLKTLPLENIGLGEKIVLKCFEHFRKKKHNKEWFFQNIQRFLFSTPLFESMRQVKMDRMFSLLSMTFGTNFFYITTDEFWRDCGMLEVAVTNELNGQIHRRNNGDDSN